MPKAAKAQPRKKFTGTRWSIAEEQLLLHLRDIKHLSFAAIADRLSRQTDAVERRYQKLKEETSLPANFIWTDVLDDQILVARRSNTPARQLAQSLGLPLGFVQDRIAFLRRTGKVPQNSTSKGPGGGTWTDEEDEVLLRMYIAMAEVAEIHETAKLGKTLVAIKARQIYHQRGEGVHLQPSMMYRKLLIEFARPGSTWCGYRKAPRLTML